MFNAALKFIGQQKSSLVFLIRDIL